MHGWRWGTLTFLGMSSRCLGQSNRAEHQLLRNCVAVLDAWEMFSRIRSTILEEEVWFRGSEIGCCLEESSRCGSHFEVRTMAKAMKVNPVKPCHTTQRTELLRRNQCSVKVSTTPITEI
jgi:hypothetical protein